MKRFVLYWLPVLIWAGMIFYASSQPYEKQDLRPLISDRVDLSFVENNFSFIRFYYAGDEISIREMGTPSFVEFFIRKSAHFFTYFTLGFLLFRALKFHLLNANNFLFSFMLTAVYASSDEFHQNFTSNRTPHIEDVMLDAVGGLVGIAIALFIYRNFKRRRYI
jgi:VanZ family protein